MSTFAPPEPLPVADPVPIGLVAPGKTRFRRFVDADTSFARPYDLRAHHNLPQHLYKALQLYEYRWGIDPNRPLTRERLLRFQAALPDVVTYYPPAQQGELLAQLEVETQMALNNEQQKYETVQANNEARQLAALEAEVAGLRRSLNPTPNQPPPTPFFSSLLGSLMSIPKRAAMALFRSAVPQRTTRIDHPIGHDGYADDGFGAWVPTVLVGTSFAALWGYALYIAAKGR